MATPFSVIYDRFLSKVTDDMFIELTELDTYPLLQELLISAIQQFEFPRVDLTAYELESFVDEATYCGVDSDNEEVPILLYDTGYFEADLTEDEIDILAIYMIVGWLGYQLASVENTRMKYSGTDFKFTSQANQMQKLNALKESYATDGKHLQRVYKRRKKDANGIMRSTFGKIIVPVVDDWSTTNDY